MTRDWPRLVATGAFAVVAAVAAVISYDHIRIVAGDAWHAPLLPLSVDGLLVAGSIALWRDRRDGHPGSVLAWASVILGLAWSLGANLAATNPDLIPRAVVEPLLAVWPPVALALAFELLIRVRRREPLTHSQNLPVEPAEAPRTVADVVATAEQFTVSEELPEPAAAPDKNAMRALADGEAARWGERQIRSGKTAGKKRIKTQFPQLSEHFADEASKKARELAAEPPVRVAR